MTQVLWDLIHLKKINGKSSFWLPSLFIGFLFIALSFLLMVFPELLAFFFAGILLFVGMFFISTAIILKKL